MRKRPLLTPAQIDSHIAHYAAEHDQEGVLEQYRRLGHDDAGRYRHKEPAVHRYPKAYREAYDFGWNAQRAGMGYGAG